MKALILAALWAGGAGICAAVEDEGKASPRDSLGVAGNSVATPDPAVTNANSGDLPRWEAGEHFRADSLRTWVQLGDGLMQRARERPEPSLFEQAEAAYRRALGVDARHVPALIGMAWVANSQHDFASGKRWARAALAVDPKAVEADALLGDAAVEMGDYDEAFERYQTCLDAQPNLSSYARAAHLLWLTGDARRAKALMRRAIDAGGPRAENVAWCQAQLALMMWHDGQLTSAEKLMQQAAAGAPTNSHVLAVRGRIRRRAETSRARSRITKLPSRSFPST